MDGHQVDINFANEQLGTLVKLDGVQVQNVVCVSFKHKVGEYPTVVLELLPGAVSIEGIGDPEVRAKILELASRRDD